MVPVEKSPPLHFDCCVTLEAMSGTRIGALQYICEYYNFEFCGAGFRINSRSDTQLDLHSRTNMLLHSLERESIKVRGYTITATLFDVSF